ncbi:UPF0481-like protein [Cinnamomum micranthum f. kanehirae]|uniref:UPF0481-like protein n=1 Tax=Cinnamomum micranthum f. kanehirae TaxID=337451 RepID=A0A443NBU7_9MAGN|nr:UPF0481-like protein [Cinnamomum micranthum f. kanehirae]
MADANEFPTPKQGDNGTKIVETSNAGEASTSRGKEVDVVIEIKDDDESYDGPRYNDWARSINEKCDGLERSNERRIPKIPIVPQQHRQGDNEAYEPKVISIGPCHRGNPRLQRMENQKLACMRQLVYRCSLVHFLHEIEAMESRARSCYSENINLQSKEFVEMMLMDGCFIGFYLLKPRQLNSRIRMHLETLGFEYIPGVLNCPSWVHDEIRNDLIFLENQLPFFVVEHMYSLVKSEDDPLLMDLAHFFWCQVSPINSKDLRSVKRTVHPLLVLHLVHLYH